MYPPVFKYIDSEDDMEKNDIYQIIIEDMSEDGSGIGHIDGMAVFVKDTVVGDTADIRIVKVKKSYAYGRLENPDATLSELGAMMDPPVGKSGINHRLAKLSEIARKKM